MRGEKKLPLNLTGILKEGAIWGLTKVSDVITLASVCLMTPENMNFISLSEGFTN